MIILIPIFTKNIHQTLDLIPTARPVQIIGLVAQGVFKVAVEGTHYLYQSHTLGSVKYRT